MSTSPNLENRAAQPCVRDSTVLMFEVACTVLAEQQGKFWAGTCGFLGRVPVGWQDTRTHKQPGLLGCSHLAGTAGSGAAAVQGQQLHSSRSACLHTQQLAFSSCSSCALQTATACGCGQGRALLCCPVFCDVLQCVGDVICCAVCRCRPADGNGCRTTRRHRAGPSMPHKQHAVYWLLFAVALLCARSLLAITRPRNVLRMQPQQVRLCTCGCCYW